FIQDTAKYILVAVLISLMSAVVYVWALAKPTRWKAYSMMILGNGLVWLGGSLTPESLNGSDANLAAFLANDKDSIVLTTIFVIGHIYVATSFFQFLIAMDNKEF